MPSDELVKRINLELEDREMRRRDCENILSDEFTEENLERANEARKAVIESMKYAEVMGATGGIYQELKEYFPDLSF